MSHGDARRMAQRQTTRDVMHDLASAYGWPWPSGDITLLTGRLDHEVSGVRLCPSISELAACTDEDCALVLCFPVREADLAGAVEHTMQRRQALIDASAVVTGGHGGVDEQICSVLGLTEWTVAAPADAGMMKLVGFVPVDQVDPVSGAVFDAGAGHIGDYRDCAWSCEGTGTFLPLDGANPTIGEVGERERVQEARLETIFPRALQGEVVEAFLRAHPYEEPAYDVYALSTRLHVGPGRFAASDDTVAQLKDRLAQWLGADVRHHPSPYTARGGTQHVLVATAVGQALPRLVEQQDVDVLVTMDPWVRGQALRRGMDVLELDRTALVQAIHATVEKLLASNASISEVTRRNGEPGETHPSDAPDDAGDSDAPSGPFPAQLWFDGGSRGNPGPAAGAFVLYAPDGTEIERSGTLLGDATNNVAEYSAMQAGLERALQLGARDLAIFSDSELVVKQVRGEYKVKHASMKPLYERVRRLLQGLDAYTIEHVPRARNSVADELVNQTLDAAAGTG